MISAKKTPTLSKEALDLDQLDLSSPEFVSSLSDSIIREYLNKKGYKDTLKMFDKENVSFHDDWKDDSILL